MSFKRRFNVVSTKQPSLVIRKLTVKPELVDEFFCQKLIKYCGTLNFVKYFLGHFGDEFSKYLQDLEQRLPDYSKHQD